jgi:hypothetical protein
LNEIQGIYTDTLLFGESVFRRTADDGRSAEGAALFRPTGRPPPQSFVRKAQPPVFAERPQDLPKAVVVERLVEVDPLDRRAERLPGRPYCDPGGGSRAFRHYRRSYQSG